MLNALELYRKYGQQDRAEAMQNQQMADQQQQREFANTLSLVQMAQQQQQRQQAMQQQAMQREQEMAFRRQQIGANAQLQRERMSQAERIARERLGASRAAAEARAGQEQKAPTGYRWSEDRTRLEKIPGGPKDDTDKMQMNADIAENKAEIVKSKVDEALKNTGFFTTGLIGDLRSTAVGRVTGSGAYDLEKTLDTIKANIGFNELQAMRMASPTGGALGQVAVQELNMLQAVLSSLDKGQSEDQLRKNLLAVKTHYDNWKNVMKKSANESQPQGGPQRQSGLSEQDRQAMQWATANPNDPRSAAIKRKLGLTQ